MKLLLDQGIPRSTAVLLRAAGHKVLHVGELGLGAAPDAEIIEIARKENSAVITLDADFHALVARSGDSSPSVIRIRDQGLKGNDVAKIIKEVLQLYAPQLKSGAFITIKSNRVRVRLLPIL